MKNIFFTLVCITIFVIGCRKDLPTRKNLEGIAPEMILVGKITDPPRFYGSYGSCLILSVKTENDEVFDVLEPGGIGFSLEKYKQDSTYLEIGEMVYFRPISVYHQLPSPHRDPSTIPIGILVSTGKEPQSVPDSLLVH